MLLIDFSYWGGEKQQQPWAAPPQVLKEYLPIPDKTDWGEHQIFKCTVYSMKN